MRTGEQTGMKKISRFSMFRTLLKTSNIPDCFFQKSCTYRS